MDEDSLRNWGYYEPDKGHHHPLGFQLISSVSEQDTKPFLSGRDNPVMVASNSSYRPRVVTEQPVTRIDFVRDSWINNRDKFYHIFPGNNQNPYSHPVLSESPGPHHHPIQMAHHHQQQQQPDPAKESPRPDLEEEPITNVKKEPGTSKKRTPAPKTSKGKKPRKGPVQKENGNSNSSISASSVQRAKRNVEVVINGVDMDITGIPIPVCSCTGTAQQCYRWGCGGWQSACCTTTISMYPLPMSTKRRGARIAGRKMSQGAFKKVLEKLASEGYDFGNSPIDLRTYWAKHGTNKFVIIR